VIKRTRTNRAKKSARPKRGQVKAPLQFPKRRSASTPSATAPNAPVAAGSLRPPKPITHYKNAPWGDVAPTEKVRKFADEIFGDFELSLQKRK
jgi:hypothetical protein